MRFRDKFASVSKALIFVIFFFFQTDADQYTFTLLNNGKQPLHHGHTLLSIARNPSYYPQGIYQFTRQPALNLKLENIENKSYYTMYLLLWLSLPLTLSFCPSHIGHPHDVVSGSSCDWLQHDSVLDANGPPNGFCWLSHEILSEPLDR